MNRRVNTMLLTVLMIALFITACGKKSESVETSVVTTDATVGATEITESTLETLEVLYDPQVDDWEDETTAPTETEPKATESKKTETKETQPKESQPKESQPKESQPKESQPKETQPKETQPKETQPKETQPKETQPKEAQPQETQPKETQPQATQPVQTDPKAKAFAEYLRKTPEQQQAYYETFASPADFFSWYNDAKSAYEASQNYIEINGGSIDLGELG